MVKNPPSNAGDARLIPGRGTKIPHTAEQLSLRATTTELTHFNKRARVPQTTGPMRPGAHTPQLEKRKPHAPQLERSPSAATKRPRHKERSHMPQRRFHVLQLKPNAGASLVAQWLRTCLPMQGTRVRALVQEDPTCRGATEPVRHNH